VIVGDIAPKNKRGHPLGALENGLSKKQTLEQFLRNDEGKQPIAVLCRTKTNRFKALRGTKMHFIP